MLRRCERRIVRVLMQVALAAVMTAASTRAADANGTDPFAPYRFLIGDWELAGEAGGPAIGISRFQWGPGQSYIRLSTSLLVDGVERPHFEGILVWNGVSRNLDMLVCMDLERGLIQEKGALTVGADGTLVREITATYGEGARPMGQPAAGKSGATARFRQTYRLVGPDRVATAALRVSDGRWVPTFPGSDRLVMTRRGK
jgi:hypothetical protein